LNPKAASALRLRVCAVSYLNSAPLVWGMLKGPQRGLFELEFAVPAQCAERLAAGRADIGLAPSIELVRQGLEVVSPWGVACSGAVRSILLISKVEPSLIRTLAADSNSRTSVALARILLQERFGVRPALVSKAPDLPAMLEAADAALLIGDPALRLDVEALPYQVLDLGQEWTELTGLPMVFAVWGGRERAWAEQYGTALAESCRYGLERLEEIVRQEAPRRGLEESLARDYLTRRIIYQFGEREYAGLRLFLECASSLEAHAQV